MIARGTQGPEREVLLPLGGVTLPGVLTVPAAAVGVVAFAHGSGSSRLSPRNRLLAAHLNDSRVATLRFDLLTPEEAADRGNVFDVDLLATRLVGATGWVEAQAETPHLPVGYFGASTTAAALRAASDLGHAIHAVVLRGGLVRFAGRVYAHGLLHGGSSLGVRAAWRLARQH